MKRAMIVLLFCWLVLAAPLLAVSELKIKPDSIDVTTNIQIVDSADGHTPETGLTITNIDMTYIRERATSVKVDATALGAVNAAHDDNKAIEIDSTNAPGLYRFDWPDAAFAVGVDFVTLVIVCTGCEPETVTVDLSTANTSVVQWTGTNVATPDTAGYPKVTIKDGTGTGEIDTDSGTVLLRSATETQIDNIETDTAAQDTSTELRTLLTGSDTAVSTLVAADNIGINWADVSNPTSSVGLTNTTVSIVSTLTGHTVQTGDSYAKVNDGTFGLSAIEGLVDDIEARLTAARAGYLDQLVDTNLPADIGTLKTRIPSALSLTGGNVHSHVKANDILTGYKIASDGLDSVSMSEPTGAPSGWDFRDWMFWLMKERYGGRVTCDNDWLKTYNDANSIITKQTVDDDGVTQTIGKVQAP